MDAIHQAPPTQDFGSVGLRVLAGTLSVSLGLSVAELNSEADARPALDSMAGLAQELIDQATQHPPSVAAALPNSRTPDDLVALLKSITGTRWTCGPASGTSWSGHGRGR